MENNTTEIVKYSNFMNELSLGSLQNRELNILMALCDQFKDQGTRQITFTFAELRRLINDHQSTNEQLFSMLKSLNKKLLDVTCEIETEEELVQFVLFTDFRTNKNFEYYKVGVNEEFAFVLNELSANFTAFELKEFVKLRSKYSKNLYRLLKQFDNDKSAWRVFEADDLRIKMGCPKSYPNKIFVRDILTPCIEELKPIFHELTLDIIKAKRRGSPIARYEFRWKYAVNDELPGQMHMSDFIDTNLSEVEKRKAVKIGNDALKGIKKAKEPKKNSFSDYEQRSYDFDKLEKQLLGDK